MPSFLAFVQSIYGNTAQPLAVLEELGAARYGLDAAGVRAALEAGQGRLVAKRGRGGRWAVFLKGE